MDIETYFIQKLLESDITQGLGDDGVIFTHNSLFLGKHKGVCLPNDISSPVYAMDMFWEGTHFKREWFSPKEIAKKAFLVNISDIVAMNATPKYALLGVAFPKNISKDFIREFLEGLIGVCKKFNIKIIGGDTISGSAFGIVVSMIGEAGKRPLFRKGAQIGDLIFHTGYIGSSYLELKRLLYGGSGNKKSRFYDPILRADFIYQISQFAHLGMDISDGVYTEINRLSKINRLDFRLNKRKEIYKSGEEYEMLFCIAPKDSLRLFRLAKKHRVHCEYIGKVFRGKSNYATKKWH